MATQNSDTIQAIILTSFAVTTLIALVVSCTCCYLWATGKEVPAAMGIFLTASVTYTFTAAPSMVKAYVEKGN